MSLHTDFPELQIGNLCGLFGYTKQAYYQNISRKCVVESKDDLVLQLIQDIRKVMPRLGTRKILHILREKYSLDIGRDHLFDVMRDSSITLIEEHNTVRANISQRSKSMAFFRA